MFVLIYAPLFLHSREGPRGGNALKKQGLKFYIIKRIAAVLLCLAMMLAVSLPLVAHAEPTGQTVRVGWHEAPYFYIDEFGRRFGYSYEYQQKIAAYTGWNYEYVEAGWSELLRMLKDGEIDMLANVSYTEERAQDFLFPSLPMGTEVYYLFVSPDNTDITTEDTASLTGKTIGVAKGSIQSGLLKQWAQTHNVNATVMEMSTTEEESLKKLGGELDAFVTMDSIANPKTAEPMWKIGSSDYYFAVTSGRSDLLAPLNAALSRIQDENVNFAQGLSDKYFQTAESNLYLSSEEKEWLDGHGTIRVGYQDNYLAFCAQDEETGELIGALKDYLDYASSALENAHIDFETIAYPSAAAAMEALKNGEIDCMFPANLIASDAEADDLVMTPALMTTEMDAVVRESDQKGFIRRETVSVAVNEGNTNYERFLIDHFPGWQIHYYKDTPAGLQAIADGKTDCVIISNYRFSNIAKQCEKLHLTTVYTGIDMDYYLAVRRGDMMLYSILAKITAIVPDGTVHAALTYYSTEDAKTSFFDNVKEHLVSILLGIALVVILILFLLLRSIRAERKATEEKRVIRDLNKQVFFDALTHVRNQGGFENYIEKLQARVEQGGVSEVAIGIFDCDNLKKMNDQYGHENGNIYLQESSRLICSIFQHSPVFRIGGDEFSVVLRGEDFKNRDALMQQFWSEQERICAEAENGWEKVSLSAGIAVYDPQIDYSVKDLIRRADQLMYENKHARKGMEHPVIR